MKQDFRKVIEKAKHIIKIITNTAYEAYFTGETVRNILLNNDLDGAEISTSASLDYLEQVFADFETVRVNNILAIHHDELVFIIRPFQAEYRKNNKEKAILRLGDDLFSDLKTRTFTIDALAMTSDGKITDIFDGYRDVNRKKIKFVGNGKLRLLDNPLNSLEAIKLVSELGFKLDYDSFNAIKRNRPLKGISLEKMIPYIDGILSGEHFKTAIFYLVNSKMHKDIPILGEEFFALNKKFQKIDRDIIISKALTRNGQVDEELLELCKNPIKAKKATELAIKAPKGQYDELLLFEYGLECALLANQINALLGRCGKRYSKIEKEYQSLPIKKIQDLKFKEEDILSKYPRITNEELSSIIEEIKYKVLTKELTNEFDELNTYVKEKIESSTYIKENIEEIDEENIVFQQNEEKKVEPFSKDFVNDDYSKLLNMERRMAEYEKKLMEKEEKINALEKNSLKNQLNNDIDILMQKYYEAIEKINVYGLAKERINREIRQAFEDALIDNLEKYEKLREKEDE